MRIFNKIAHNAGHVEPVTLDEMLLGYVKAAQHITSSVREKRIGDIGLLTKFGVVHRQYTLIRLPGLTDASLLSRIVSDEERLKPQGGLATKLFESYEPAAFKNAWYAQIDYALGPSVRAAVERKQDSNLVKIGKAINEGTTLPEIIAATDFHALGKAITAADSFTIENVVSHVGTSLVALSAISQADVFFSELGAWSTEELEAAYSAQHREVTRSEFATAAILGRDAVTKKDIITQTDVLLAIGESLLAKSVGFLF